MKILFCHFGIYKKDGWGRTFSLAKGLANHGEKVILLTTNPKFSFFIKSEIIDNVKVIIFPDIIYNKFCSKGFGLLSIILKLIFSFFMKFDIVHSDSGHRPSSGWPCILNKLVHKSTYVAEWWDYFGKGGQLENKPKYFRVLLGKFETWSEINDKKKADGVVVLSHYMKKRAINCGIPEEKIKIIYGGADIVNIKKLLYLKNKEKYGIIGEKLIFGYIGISNNEISDLEPFLNAIKEYKNKIVLVTFGEKLDKNIIKKYDLKNNILEMGWIDFSRDAQKLEVVDIFVLIKKNNAINNAGWPNKLGDYLACGRPILVTPYDAIENFIEKFPNCFIKCEWDTEDIKKILLRILNNQYNLKKMGIYSRHIAESYIAWDEKARELKEFYKYIINYKAN